MHYIRIRAYQATSEHACALQFVEGHKKLLEIFGITQITSAKDGWIENPSVYVIQVESLEGDKVYGGVRIHIADGVTPLPVEDAVGSMDDKIFTLVKNEGSNRVGELCGFWNSREVAGWGIGSVYLARAAVTIAPQLKVNSLFALCAPYTVKMAATAGFMIETSLGDRGTFYYPKDDLLATVMFLKDTANLPLATIE
jgi:hypothetical protein